MGLGGELARLQIQGIQKIPFNVLRPDGAGVVTGENGADGGSQGKQLFLAFDVLIQIPVRAEHENGAVLLHRIAGNQQALLPVKEGSAASGVTGNGNDLQPVLSAAEHIPLVQRMDGNSLGNHGPVRLHGAAGAEGDQASGVIRVGVGQQHRHRQIGDGFYRLVNLAVGKAGVDEQGAVPTRNQKSPDPSVVQNVKLMIQFGYLHRAASLFFLLW